MIRLWDHCPIAWRPTLEDLLMGRVGKDLEALLCAEVELGKEVYPAIDSVFKCLCHLEAGDVRAVILGQDPYHQPSQATGRAFEVPDGVDAPPSLRNILKLLAKDLGREPSHPGLLAHWESEGVLLLNTVLTVSKGEPESHRNHGWEVITDRLIEAVAQSSTQTVFFLWGAHAQKKATLIEGEQNLVLTAPHPSPLSAYRGFFDAQQFSRANQWLSLRGQPPINWLGD